MKNILIICFLLISFSIFSQKYPRIEKDSSGNQVVIMTVEQVQKIDNDLEILSLLEEAIIDCENLNNSYIKVIDEQKKTIANLEISKDLLNDQLLDKDKSIENLKQRLNNAISLSDECEKQKTELNNKVDVLQKEVKHLKIRRNVGYGAGILGVIGVILTLIIK
jgi:DNA anti-recombination protein RmuC